jgi:hypothetical protein
MLNRAMVIGMLLAMGACGSDECPAPAKEVAPGKCQWPGGSAGHGTTRDELDGEVVGHVGIGSAGRVSLGGGGAVAADGVLAGTGGAGSRSVEAGRWGSGGVTASASGGTGGVSVSTGSDGGMDAPVPQVQPHDPTDKPVMVVTAMCGDGHVDPGEKCDGDCPDTCDDNNACTDDEYVGKATECSVECKRTTLPDGTRCGFSEQMTTCQKGECKPLCGNGKVDSGETCDGNCPASCDDSNPCTADILQGTGCAVTCMHKPATYASCPGGTCDSNGMCQVKPVAMCGDGRVDTGELCDGNCPTTCPSPYECNVGKLVGTGCQRKCTADYAPSGTVCKGGTCNGAGICEVKAECAQNADCSGAEFARCTNDDNTCDGEVADAVCNGGKCVVTVTSNPNACKRDITCGTGYARSMPCPLGCYCSSSLDCTDGYRCTVTGGGIDGRCVPQ